MNRKAIIVALLASLAISMLLWNNLQKSSTPPRVEAPVVQQPTIILKPVVVSTRALSARTRLDEELVNSSFEIRRLPASGVPELAFPSLASITNKYTAVPIFPDDIITEPRLTTAEQIPNLARAVPPGKRAVSIAVSRVTSVGGFIQQGDFVDVIATFRPRGSEPITKIVLQDIQILAVGTTYQFDGNIPTSTPAISAAKMELVTVAVSPDELERLMHLDSGTSFRFVLKNPEEKGTRTNTRGATERLVLRDIGYTESAEPINGSSQQPVTIISDPVDDGKVEIMYGAHNKRELYKYGGPAAKAFRDRRPVTSEYAPPAAEAFGANAPLQE